MPVAASENSDNYIVVFDSSSHVNKDEVRARGADIKGDLTEVGVLAVQTAQPSALESLPGVVGVAVDQMRFQVPDDQVTSVEVDTSGSPAGCATTQASCGFQWDLARMHVPQAWQQTMGSPNVKVAILDTGVNSTHQEVVGANYDKAESRSFVQANSICAADATTYNTTEDLNGHGTWTSTHIAGANGRLMTGIAPGATFVNLRVAGACGYAADSWVMHAMLYGNQIGARVENMSLGGRLCGQGIVKGSFYCGTAADVGTDPVLWRAYKQIVNYLLDHGTLVVASAGNEHAQLNGTGRYISHGSLARTPTGPNPRNDFFGMTRAPGGIPGVVTVAATNRLSAQGSTTDASFGQYGAGRTDQLAYYSNYGAGIDVVAPGGAQNMNVPNFDCLTRFCAYIGSPAAMDNPGDLGAWGTRVGPCVSNCYVFQQGTSMATAQVSGVAVLALSVNPELSPRQLAGLLRRSVTEFGNPNATPSIEDDPSKPTYNYSMDYDAAGISNRMMGKGVIDAARAVAAAGEDN